MKDIAPTVELQERVKIYVAVIQSASANGLEKNTVPGIADNIWNAIIQPLGDDQATDPRKKAASLDKSQAK